MKDWHWDGRETRGEPQGTASWPSVEGGQTTRCGPLGRREGIIGELFYPPVFLSVSRDSQSDRRNSPLGKEKAPCSEQFGSLMGSQYDQRGGGPDERTNNGPKDSCHRSHVGALARGSVDHKYLLGGASLTGQAVLGRTGKERPEFQLVHDGQVRRSFPCRYPATDEGVRGRFRAKRRSKWSGITPRRKGVSQQFSVHLI
jgi:hypothetical protein